MTRHTLDLALLTVGLAFAVRWVLDPLLLERAPFLIFTFVVLAAAVMGGARVGLFATAVSTVVALWAFVPGRGSPIPTSVEYSIETASFIAVSVALSLLAGRMRAARVLAEAGEAGEAEVRRLNRDLETLVAARPADLEVANTQLEAFAYTGSHDLRASLRGMEGFASILLDDFAESLGPKGRRHAERIEAAAQRMEALISDLLTFSRLQRAEINLRGLDPTGIMQAAAEDARASVGPEQTTIRVEGPVQVRTSADDAGEVRRCDVVVRPSGSRHSSSTLPLEINASTGGDLAPDLIPLRRSCPLT